MCQNEYKLTAGRQQMNINRHVDIGGWVFVHLFIIDSTCKQLISLVDLLASIPKTCVSVTAAEFVSKVPYRLSCCVIVCCDVMQIQMFHVSNLHHTDVDKSSASLLIKHIKLMI